MISYVSMRHLIRDSFVLQRSTMITVNAEKVPCGRRIQGKRGGWGYSGVGVDAPEFN
jgi:hypothetical protein